LASHSDFPSCPVLRIGTAHAHYEVRRDHAFWNAVAAYRLAKPSHAFVWLYVLIHGIVVVVDANVGIYASVVILYLRTHNQMTKSEDPRGANGTAIPTVSFGFALHRKYVSLRPSTVVTLAAACVSQSGALDASRGTRNDTGSKQTPVQFGRRGRLETRSRAESICQTR
jgi:hypothetical protein